MTKREFNQDPEAVTEAREARKMSKATLARLIGCSRSLITEIEGDTRNAREELLAAMAKVLDVPAEQLRRNPGEPGRTAAQAADVEVRQLQNDERAVAANLPELRPVADPERSA